MQSIQMSAVVAALHLLALALGLPSVVIRARALRRPLDDAALSRLFAADTVWGLAALIWIGTGLLRAFAGLEKGSGFYLASSLFWVKMGLLATILVLEVLPMATFIRWRIQRGHGHAPDTTGAGRLYRINQIQIGLVVTMVFVASFMARGVGFGS
jgi:putative membrane protein